MKHTYFDAKHFGSRLRAAIVRKELTILEFQRAYFPETPYNTVNRWVNGVCMPGHEAMQTLIDVFGWNRVKRWLRFTFDTTSKKQVS